MTSTTYNKYALGLNGKHIVKSTAAKPSINNIPRIPLIECNSSLNKISPTYPPTNPDAQSPLIQC